MVGGVADAALTVAAYMAVYVVVSLALDWAKAEWRRRRWRKDGEERLYMVGPYDAAPKPGASVYHGSADYVATRAEPLSDGMRAVWGRRK